MLATIKRHIARPRGEDATTDPWGELMVAAQGGNGGAYKRLLTEVNVWLRRYYARRLPASMVEDAAQETILTVHNRRHTYQPGRPFRPWLAGIARYKWIDRLRALARDPATPGVDGELDALSVGDHGAAVTSALVLRELLDRLKPTQAMVIRLVKLDGLSIEEASAITGQSLSLVKVNIHRGLTKLRGFVEASA